MDKEKIKLDTTDSSDSAQNPFVSKLRACAKKYVEEHSFAVLGAVIGLIFALFIFIIGFWHTLFICICVILGVAIGQIFDGNPKIVNFIKRFINNER